MREQKEREVDIKAGFSRIKINNLWKSWAEVEKKGEKEKEKKREEIKGIAIEAKGGEEMDENFV